jgi:rubrerythrin
MTDKELLDVIKGAILLEKKGKSLYESVVQTTDVEEVKNLFSMLAEEEKQHIAVLEQQFSLLSKQKDFDLTSLENTPYKAADKVLSDKVAQKVTGAGYEAAVISAAIELEKNAVKYYSKQATIARSEGQKKLFEWLSIWEKGHMQMLAQIDVELKEQIWFDNKFWPLD